MNSIEQLEALKKQVIELQEKLNKLTWKDKWDPKGGGFTIVFTGNVFEYGSDDDSRLFGTERETKELAEKAAVKMRQFNRLLAYHDEFCPDYEFKEGNDNYFIYLSSTNNTWCYSDYSTIKIGTEIYFPKNIAIELVKKLNSGEVEL